MPSILIESGPLRGQSFQLPRQGAIGIGRDVKCAIQLPDGMVSRIHCILRGQEDRWTLEDKKSLNATFVNDVRATQKELESGDVIRLGDTLLSFVADLADSLAGKSIAGYRIEKRLGRGAMGTVYRAHQISVDRPVALKILDARLAGDSEFTASFLQEARAAGKLNHPNVVQVYDAGIEGGIYYISMEFLPGGSLQELLDREDRLEPARAVAMAIDAARALGFAASRRIVHRDIKPANLLLTAEGAVKVGDLGIAADLKRQAATGAAQLVGSPRYMAPEQAQGKPVDHRADIYALGATLYRTIAGVPPFEGTTVREILTAKIARDPPPLREREPSVPIELSSVVQKMLARDPGARFSTATEVEQALSRAMAPRRRRRARVARLGKRSSLPAGAFVAAPIVLLLCLVIYFASRSGGERPARDETAADRPRIEASRATAVGPFGPAARDGRREDVTRAEYPGIPDRRTAGDGDAERTSSAMDSRARSFDERSPPSDDTGAQGERPEPTLRPANAPPARPDGAEGEKARTIAEKRAEALAALSDAAREAHRALGLLDFAVAQRSLEKFCLDWPPLEGEAAPHLQDLKRARAAWQVIEGALLEKRKEKKSLSMTFALGPLQKGKPSPRSYQVLDLSGCALRVQPAGSKIPETRCVLSLEAASLLDLAGKGAGEELREGLGLLALLHRGPEAGRAILVDPSAPAEVRKAAEERIGALSTIWLQAGLAAAGRRMKAYEAASPPPPADAWDFAASELAELIAGWPARLASGEAIQKLESYYLASREKALLALPPHQFFHAKEVKLEKEVLELAYDFSAPEQLEDFYPVQGVSGALECVKSQKSLRLVGEVRLLDGNPFRGFLSVSARTAPQSLEKPNVNVAFWTAPGDVLTLQPDRIDLRRWRDRGPDGELKDDFFVLGMGYGLEVDLEKIAGPALARLLKNFRSFLPVYLRESSFVILGGTHGKTLHVDPRELIWEMSAVTSLKGPFAFQASFDEEGKLQWSTNRRTVPCQGSPNLKRLKEAAPCSGSLTFFTNGSIVLLGSLKVSGKLNPTWFQTKVRKTVEEELKKLERLRPPSESPPAGSEEP